MTMACLPLIIYIKDSTRRSWRGFQAAHGPIIITRLTCDLKYFPFQEGKYLDVFLVWPVFGVQSEGKVDVTLSVCGVGLFWPTTGLSSSEHHNIINIKPSHIKSEL